MPEDLPSSPPELPDPRDQDSPAREWNPYAPPKAELPPLPFTQTRPAFRGMSFGKRLLLLPVWYLLASIPAGVVVFGTIQVAESLNGRARDLAAVTGYALAYLPLSYLIYRWLAVPFQLNRGRRLKWALLGVPVVAAAWIAFLLAVVFAVCGIFFLGFN